VNPRTSNDTRQFLRDRMFGLGDALGLLGHPADLIGLRVGLRPNAAADPHGGTPAEDSANFALRIESWQQDPRSLFIELAGNFGPISYLLGGAPQEFSEAPTGAAVTEESILATYRYLEHNVLPFIGKFDRRSEERRSGE
jgi:hypothetical protein